MYPYIIYYIALKIYVTLGLDRNQSNRYPMLSAHAKTNYYTSSCTRGKNVLIRYCKSRNVCMEFILLILQVIIM